MHSTLPRPPALDWSIDTCTIGRAMAILGERWTMVVLREVFNGIREGVLTDRSQFYRDLSESFFGANREGSSVSQGAKDDFWRQGMLVNLAAAYDCVKAFSETDFTEDLKALDVPILIAQGDDDQIVPIAAAALRSIDLVKDGRLVVYPGAPHGIYGAYQKALDAAILEFIDE